MDRFIKLDFFMKLERNFRNILSSRFIKLDYFKFHGSRILLNIFSFKFNKIFCMDSLMLLL
jgi:hypothetical protein